MKLIAILLIIIGVAGIALGCSMFGDIAIAAIIGATSALLSGLGFLLKSGTQHH